MNGRSGGAGLYVHVPFCARACPYCDFDFVAGGEPDLETYFDGLERELSARPELADLEFDTVYVGGGTPSQLGPDGLRRLFDRVHARLPGTARSQETTVELNPEHTDARLVAALADLGVHRVSLGTQTLSPTGLRQLGRVHDRAASLSAVAGARATGLRVSADLIVGWAGQTTASLCDDIAALCDHGVEHLSVYALTIEPGTPWERLVGRGQRAHPDPEAQTDLLFAAESALTGAGFAHYEVSSYGRLGAQARHNLKYWTWADYVGLGPSAASARFESAGVTRRTNRRGLAGWSSAPGEPAQVEHLAPLAAAAEGLWTGLRRLEGFDVDRFLARFPAADQAWLEQRTRRQVERGNLAWEGAGRLAVAPGRWVFHDSVALDLLA